MQQMEKDWYHEALAMYRARNLQQAFEDYVKVFLPRLSSLYATSQEFCHFFRYQMAAYLAEKNSYYLGLPEGDMISDLIEMTYEEFLDSLDSSDMPLSPEGRVNLLSEIQISFPCQKEPVRSLKKCCGSK